MDKPLSDGLKWWNKLGAQDKERVKEWLRNNPPPDYWTASDVEYAFLEMAGL